MYKSVEVGNKYGKLMVVSVHTERRNKSTVLWTCVCDCGPDKTIVVKAGSLMSGWRRSCGCATGGKLDLRGLKQGYLTVISETDKRSGGSSVVWLCHCDGCDKDAEIAARLLKRGQKSCGCKAHEAIEPIGLMGLIKYYKANARAKGLEWNLPVDACRDLFFGRCVYCTAEPYTDFTYTGVKIPITIKRNGIDRIDNKLGYISGNVSTCCWECNYMKGTKSLEDFMAAIAAIYENWIASPDNANTTLNSAVTTPRNPDMVGYI